MEKGHWEKREKMFGEFSGNKYTHGSDRTASDGILAQELQFPRAVIKQLRSSTDPCVWGFPRLLCSERRSRALIESRWRSISQVAPWKNIPAHKSNYKRAGFLTLARAMAAV